MHPRLLATALLAAFTLAAAAQSTTPRPKITGVSHLAVYTSDAAAADHYYRQIVGAAKLPDPENPQGVRYAVSSTQFIEVLPLPADAGINRLDHTAWITESAEGMRKYLAAKGWKTPGKVEKGADGSRWFAVLDPEGNKVEFVQPPVHPVAIDAPNAIGHHIIHVGYMVHDRAAEDKFYAICSASDLTGGAAAADKIEWVSQQCPDGHDWMEYMMTRGTSGIPADHDAARTGRDGPPLNWRGFGPGVLQGARGRQSARRDGMIRHQRSGSTANISSTCTIPTASARK